MSPGGVAFEREVIPPDWVLDYWHPLEKAQYPEYFARREKRKEEYVTWWEKQYGKATATDSHHHWDRLKERWKESVKKYYRKR